MDVRQELEGRLEREREQQTAVLLAESQRTSRDVALCAQALGRPGIDPLLEAILSDVVSALPRYVHLETRPPE